MRPDFARLALADQTRELQSALAAGQPLETLLDVCAELSDPTPLAWLCSLPGILSEHITLLAERITLWPETSLLKVLKALPPQPALERVLRGALDRLGLERLAVLALLERSLKHNFPESYEQYLQEIEAALPSERSLALLPSRSLEKLTPAQRQRRAELARQALEQLSRQPKAVSLSHAEELLSKRVYTQPGHFLFELLQNAEDAQARCFQVNFEADRVVIWHDGLPFDIRDLVGVTSIGQTTKRKQQIGFFGVGFKSIYEVTDRPQIYSDVFCFEIIDVSIPRALERPAEVSEQGTTLILPLKKPFPELPQVARQMDPAVLLTLSHLQEIRLGPDWLARRQGDCLSTHETKQVYWIQEQTLSYSGSREAGRPDHTRLMLAVLVDGDGQAQPPAPGAPTIYSYLPTSQDSGLRFLLHSHFDVPVDRERIHPESAWNRWILDQVPEVVAQLAARHNILEVLPLPGETSGPFTSLPHQMGQALASVDCLPGGRRPDETWISSPEIADLGLPLPLWSPQGRLLRLAVESLQMRRFGTAQLIDYLEEHPPEQNHAEIFVILLQQWEDFRERLVHLANVPNAEGQLKSPAQLCLARPGLRALYPPSQLVDARFDSSEYLQRLECQRLELEDLVQDLEQGMPLADPDLALQLLAEAAPALRQRAARLPLFLAQDGLRYPLAKDIHSPGAARASHQGLAQFYAGRRPLLAQDYPEWPVLELDFPNLALDLLNGQIRQLPHPLLEEGYRHIPEVLLQCLAGLPLWPDRPLVGARRASHPEIPLLMPHLTFLPEELARWAHVQFLTPKAVGPEALLEHLSSLPQPERALEFLVEHAEEISTGAAARLLAQSALPDDQAQITPVTEQVRAETPQLRALYRDGLSRSFASPIVQKLLQRLGLLERLRAVGTSELIADLEGHLPGPDQARELVAYLAARAGELTRDEARQVLSMPLFPDRPAVDGSRPRWVQPGLRQLLLDHQWDLLPEPWLEDVQELAIAAAVEEPGIRQILPHSESFSWSSFLPLLVEYRSQLTSSLELSNLALWPSLSGLRLRADQVVDFEPLREIFPAAELELIPQAWGYFQALQPLVKPLNAREYLSRRLDQEARPGYPLNQQPDFLSTPDRVKRVALLLGGQPQIDGNGLLCLQSLPGCDELTLSLLPESLRGQVSLNGTLPLPTQRVLQALSELEPRHWRSDSGLRQRFYQWIQEQESRLFSCPDSRQILRTYPFWLSQQQRLLAATQLVFDADVPELGVDWYPHPEVPAQLCEILSRQLKVGRFSPQDMLESHLLPAYREATLKTDEGRTETLLNYLMTHFSHRPGLLGRDFPVRDRRGRYRPAPQVLLPDPDLAWEELLPDDLLCARYSGAQQGFLKSLGLATMPSWDKLEEVFERPRRNATSLALARVLHELSRRLGSRSSEPPGGQSEEVLQMVPGFRRENWIQDALGAPRRAAELFIPSPEVESLIGQHGRLYPSPELAAILGESLMEKLGMRTVGQVGLDEVLAHLKLCSQSGQSVGIRPYQWLEKGLTGPGLPDLKARLHTLKWIFSDDGIWFSHRQIVAVSAFTLFGKRRGYWLRGAEYCPNLCRLFGIPTQITPAVVVAFLEELAVEVQRLGDQEILKKDRALNRMLPECYRYLTERPALSRQLPVILAQSAADQKKRLVAADHPALVSSDTPSLERLFQSLGLLVAVPGNLEQRADLERFHRAMGIRNLRDAFSVSLDPRGRDCSPEYAEGLAALRSRLRALLAVLPRVQKQRDQLSADGWIYQQKLKPLAQTGGLRAIQDLRIDYELKGVGKAAVEAAGAYDPARGELLVEARLLSWGQPNTLVILTGLAQALLPCIYQGPGEDQLIDILEILLPLAQQSAMDAYLDARHFPSAAPAEATGSDRLSERLGEMLDYQLDQQLALQFPELVNLEGWRQADLLAGCQSPEEAAQRLLVRSGVEAGNGPLRDKLIEIFQASHLNQVALPRPALQEPEPSEPPCPSIPNPEMPGPESPSQTTRGQALEPQPAAGPGLLTRVRDWFLGSSTAQDVMAQVITRLPSWLEKGQALAPRNGIETQFWGTRRMQEALSHRPAGFGLFHQPTKLPKPYLYAAHQICGSFEPSSQSWAQVRAEEIQTFALGQPTGRRILFEGNLQPGNNVLPIPFYSRLAGPLQLKAAGRVTKGPLGSVMVAFGGDSPSPVRYQVELMNPPRLSSAEVRVPESWLRPTVSRLPDPVESWMSQVRHRAPWERALAALEFVTRSYAYDSEYLEHPQARRLLSQLPNGQGNHHLMLLHARQQDGWLGFGICYELSVSLCEILRHLGVPSLLASGWALDEGFAAVPDHMFALAVLASLEGPCLMPLDPAFSGDGPLRPSGRAQPPQGHLPHAPPVAGPGGAWSASAGRSPGEALEKFRELEAEMLRHQLECLQQAVSLVLRQHRLSPGRELQAALSGQLDVEQALPVLQQALQQQLPSPELATALVQLFAGEHQSISRLTPTLEELVRLDLAQVRNLPMLQVTPKRWS